MEAQRSRPQSEEPSADFLTTPMIGKGFDREVKRIRKSLPYGEFERHQKQRERDVQDPIGALERRKQWYEQRLQETTNETIREEIQTAISLIPDSIAQLRDAIESDKRIRELMFEEKHYRTEQLKLAALAQGPTKLQVLTHFVRTWFSRIKPSLKRAMDWCLSHSVPIFYLTWAVCGIVGIIYCITVGLGVHFSAFALFWIILAFSAGVYDVQSSGNNKFRVGLLGTMILLFGLMFNVVCFAPMSDYVTVITSKSGAISLVDSQKQWFMKPPSVSDNVRYLNLITKNTGWWSTFEVTNYGIKLTALLNVASAQEVNRKEVMAMLKQDPNFDLEKSRAEIYTLMADKLRAYLSSRPNFLSEESLEGLPAQILGLSNGVFKVVPGQDPNNTSSERKIWVRLITTVSR